MRAWISESTSNKPVMKFTEVHLRALKLMVFVLCLLPALMLGWDAARDALGANPIEEIIHRTGDWALRLLLITLMAGPLWQWFGLVWPMQFRRMLGLYAFFYAAAHFLTYVGLDQYFDWVEIYGDVIKKPYIAFGFGAFLILIPLTLTSFGRAIDWLGKKRWKSLHQLVYVAAILAVMHYLWLVKADLREPLIYTAWLLLLLVSKIVGERRTGKGD